MRTCICAALALAVLAGSLRADETEKKKKKKAALGSTGEIVKVDAKAGTVTIKVTLTKKSTEEKVFTLTTTTTVSEAKGDAKTELKADSVEKLLGMDQFETGVNVSFEADTEGKALKSLTLGVAAKKKKKKNDQ